MRPGQRRLAFIDRIGELVQALETGEALPAKMTSS
jgi:hypothetical protein